MLARSGLGILLVACLACTSCVSGLLHVAMHRPPQGWDRRRGPVVPHDNFPADCSICHAGGSWHEIHEGFVFDHLAATGVPLLGAHAGAECLRCHNDRGPVGVFAQRGCSGCHEDIHQGQLGVECTLCHTENDWRPQGQFAMHNRTRFPLAGAHVAVACWRCHPGAQVGNFTRAPVECEHCHQEDLQRATSPDHLAAGWTTDCQRCHQPIAWQGKGFVHSGFPLVGAHGAVECQTCHTSGTFSRLARDCASCHLDDYQATTAPNHQAPAYSTTCESCHTPTAWQAATFSHTGITADCVGCHLSEYNNTNDPNHAAASFPTTCETCHDVNTWQGASFNHRFRINSGPHGGSSCQTCHQVPNNYSVVSCTHCHKHRQSAMDDKHHEVSGYSWNSTACVSCHPTGRE
jgi:hypothetical protein